MTPDVAVMSSGADLVGRNATTGAFLWTATGANRSTAGQAGPVVGGSLVLSGHPNVVGVVSLADGSTLGSTPAVGLDVNVIASNGHVFVDGANTLYAFAPSP